MHECVNNAREKKRTADRHRLLVITFFETAELKCYFVCYIVVGLPAVGASTSFFLNAVTDVRTIE